MTLEENTEAMTLKRRLRVLYRNEAVLVRHEPTFRIRDYEDVATAESVVAALTTQLGAFKNTQEA